MALLKGTKKKDNLVGTSGNDTILGLDDDDVLSGGGGNDKLIGGDGDDSLSGGGGDDVLAGGDGNDWALGGRGDDTLNGGDGDDRLVGEQGDDTLSGGTGNDVLVGGTGNDLIRGGSGVDKADYAGNSSAYTFSLLGTRLLVQRGTSTDQVTSDVELLRFNDKIIDLRLPTLTGGADHTEISEDGRVTLDVLGNDLSAFVDLTTANITAFTQGANGTVTDNGDGTFTYVPDANFSGTDTFTYTLSDISGRTPITVTVTVDVAPVNDAPVATNGAVTVAEDQAGGIAIDVASLISDVETADGSLTVSATVPAAQGSVSVSGTVITFTPALNFNGPASISYSVSDGSMSSNGSIAVTVTAADDNPTAPGTNSVTTNEDTASSPINIGGADVDGDALTYTVKSGSEPANGTVTFAGGAFVYTPNTNANGVDTFTIEVSDGAGTKAEQVVSVTITPVNDAPVATNGAVTVAEDQAGGIAIDVASLISDVETADGSLTVSATVPAAQGSVSVSGTVITFTPALNFNGPASISYSVSDGSMSSNGSIAVTVTAADDNPTAPGTNSVTTNEDTASSPINIGGADVDGDALTYTVKSGSEPANGTVTFAGGAFVYTPNANANGVDTFTIEVSDGAGTKAEQVVSVTITPVNDTPTVSGPITAGVTEGSGSQSINLLAGASDVDTGETATLAVTGVSPLPAGVTLSGNSLVVDTDDTAFNGLAAGATQIINVSYTVQDVHGAPVAQTAEITVTGVNDGPSASASSSTGNEDTVVAVQLAGTDPDLGDAIDSFTVSTLPANGTLHATAADALANINALSASAVVTAAGNTATLFFRPTADWNGSTDFTYTATDGTATSAAETASITINAVNDAPVGADDSDTTSEGSGPLSQLAATGLLDNDSDVDTAHASLVVSAVNGSGSSVGASVSGSYGSVTVNADGSWTYTLDARAETLADGQTETETFSYTVSDGSLTGTALLTITVGGINDAPIANTDVGAIDLATEASTDIDVLANDRDVDQGTILSTTLPSATTAKGGTVSIVDGVVTYTPGTGTFFTALGAGQIGVDSFTYALSDGLVSVSKAVYVHVTGENDTPVVDLNGASAGIDYAGASQSAAALSGDVDGEAIQSGISVSDPDLGDVIHSMLVELGAVADTNGAGGDNGYLTLTATGAAIAAALGVTISTDLTDTLEFIATTGDITTGQAQQLLAEVRYVNNETTFALDVDARTITVTVTDAGGLTSAPATASVEVIADVTDPDDIDAFTGTQHDDRIDGGAGNDVLDGGLGADTLIGGIDDDIYYVDDSGDIVTELLGEGTDEVRSSITYSLIDTDGAGTDGGNVDNLTLTGTDAIDGTGNDLANTIIGNDAANTLVGGDGDDGLSGGLGTDSFTYDLATEEGDTDTIDGGDDTDQLTITGTTGDDQFNLAAVLSDIEIEIAANGAVATVDKDLVVTQLDNIIINTGTGADVVTISGDFTGTGLAASTITIDGSADAVSDSVDAGGITSGHRVVFNAGDGDDEFISGAGSDIFDAGGGIDTASYAMAASGVTVDLSQPDVNVTGGGGNDMLTGVENVIGSDHDDTIAGDGMDNEIRGGGGDDVIAGGGGTDSALFTGDLSDYTVTINVDGQFVVTDTIPARDGTDTLDADIEHIVFNDVTLDTTAPVRLFDGANLIGTFSTIVDAEAASSAGNTIVLTGDYLGPEFLNVFVDDLTITGPATATDIDLTLAGTVISLTLGGDAQIDVTGNGEDNIIIGNAAVNELKGGGGSDTLTGGDAADYFGVVFDSATVTDLGAGGADILEVIFATVNATAAADWTATASTINDGTVTVTAEGHNLDVSLAGGSSGWTLTNAGNATGVSLTGSANVDTITGGDGDDTLTGGDAADTLNVEAGTDEVTDLGAGGTDVLVVSAGATVNATAADGWTASTSTSNDGTATITADGHDLDVSAAGGASGWTLTNAGNATGVSLTGSANADTIIGGEGSDTLTGGDDDDTMTGGGAADTFNVDAGTDEVTDLGAGGVDDLIVSAGATVNATAAADWTASVATNNDGTAAITADGHDLDVSAAGGANGWTLTNAGNATGVSLTGSANADTITGGDGDDTIEGGTGVDTVSGGDGDDTVNWTTGDGDDTIHGGGNATATGDTLAIVKTGGTLATVTAGMTGFTFDDNAELIAADEVERLGVQLQAGATVTLTGAFALSGLLAAAIDGSSIADTVDAGDADDIDVTFNGGDGDDTFVSGSGDDTFAAGSAGETSGDTVSYAGADSGVTVDLGTGTATGDGSDTLTGVENVTGSDFADSITGDGNDNTLSGGADIDTIVGGAGDDTIDGGDGDDVLTGGLGADIINGGAGDDTFHWSAGDGDDTIDGGSGSETLGDLLDVTATGSGNTITVNSATLAIDAETIGYSNLERISINAGLGDDTIEVNHLTGATLTVSGGGDDGVDITTAGSGALISDDGGDTLYFKDLTSGTGVTVSLIGGTFKETGSLLTHAVSGVENVTGSDFDDNVIGSTGSNILAGGDGTDSLSGLAGVDVIKGEDGDDTLFGGNDTDHLLGGIGKDAMSGDSGADFFYFLAADNHSGGDFDTLKGFSVPGNDKLVVQSGAGSFTSLVAAFDFVSDDIGPGNAYGGGTPGVATFVIDTVTGVGESVSLWYDDAGDGVADFKVTEFDNVSNLSGMSTATFIII